MGLGVGLGIVQDGLAKVPRQVRQIGCGPASIIVISAAGCCTFGDRGLKGSPRAGARETRTRRAKTQPRPTQFWIVFSGFLIYPRSLYNVF